MSGFDPVDEPHDSEIQDAIDSHTPEDHPDQPRAGSLRDENNKNRPNYNSYRHILKFIDNCLHSLAILL